LEEKKRLYDKRYLDFEVDANPDLFILFGDGNYDGHPIRMLLFPDETRLYELLDF